MSEPGADVIQWLEKLSGAGFGTLVGLILFGNFMGIWVWGKWHRERIAAADAQIAKIEAEKNEWKDMALGLLTPLETTLGNRPGKRGER